MELKLWLEDLESRIDPQEELRLEREWTDFADGLCGEPFFSPRRPPSAPGLKDPPIRVNDAFGDESLMVCQQLWYVSRELMSGKGNLLNVRANYGTGIIPSMFGAELFFLDPALDTLPCAKPLTDGEQGIRRMLDERAPDFRAGLAGKVFRFAERYAEAVAPYPKVRRFVHVCPPDLQGPFPLAEELWGSGIYLAFYEEPELLRETLACLTEVFLAFFMKWQALFPSFDRGHGVEWGLLHRGAAMIRNDACTNISGELYREFVRPCDQRILLETGGGVHFCGRGDHYIGQVCSMENISCVNLSQPELNDMETIYRATVDRGIHIIGLPEEETLRAVRAGRGLRGRAHSGASLAAWKDLPSAYANR